MSNNITNIAIDGPAGAGKSTIAKCVAKQLGFVYIDTGAMYRAIAFYFLRNKIEELEKQKEACKNISIIIEYKNGEQQVLLNNENITPFIRTEEVGKMATIVAKEAEVRKKLVELQKELARKTNVVMDGRDIGTCVLPKAEVKIYLTASTKVRAERRWKELKEKEVECNIEQIEKDIIDRDEQDKNREISPLCQAKDAVLVDSSYMSISEVVEMIIGIYNKKKREKK